MINHKNENLKSDNIFDKVNNDSLYHANNYNEKINNEFLNSDGINKKTVDNSSKKMSNIKDPVSTNYFNHRSSIDNQINKNMFNNNDTISNGSVKNANNINKSVDNHYENNVGNQINKKEFSDKYNQADNIKDYSKYTDKYKLKSDKKTNLKSIGGALARKASKSASQSDDDLTRLAGKTGNTIFEVKNVIKSSKVLIAFFSTPAGWITLLILGIMILIIFIVIASEPIISGLSTKYGTTYDDVYNTFNSDYQIGMRRNSIDSIDKQNNLCKNDASFWAKLGLSYNLKNVGDLCLYINDKVLKDSEEKTKITVPPGYLISILSYAYSTSGVNSEGDNNKVAEGNDYYNLNELNLIASLFEAKIYNKNSIYDEENLDKNASNDAIINNYIVKYDYTYSKLVKKKIEEDKEDTEENEEQYEEVCQDYTETSYAIDELKLKLFLRYGKEVAASYQRDLNNNKAYEKTSPSCLNGKTKVDMSKYNITASIDNEEDDYAKINVDGKEYGYDTGFIFKTYPKFKSEKKYDYFTDKTIEQIINDISDKQEYYNYALGYNSIFSSNNLYNNCTYDVNGSSISDLKVRLLYGAWDIDPSKKHLVGTPIEGEELIPYEDYIYGVVYHEIGIYDQDEYAESWKAQAIMARSFGLSRPSKHDAVSLEQENGQWILSIRNSNDDMAYCNPDTGCYICPGYGTNTFSANALPEGMSTDTCTLWLGPHAKKDIMKKHVDETKGILLYDSSGDVALSGWLSDTYKILDLAKENKDYTEMLQIQYEGEYTLSRSTCINGIKGTLSEEQKEAYLSKIFSIYPDINQNRIQAVKVALNSYGLPYFWGGGHGSLEDMVDVAENKWGKEYCTIIYGGLSSQPAGSQQLCGFDCSGFVRYIMYAGSGIDPGAAGTEIITSENIYKEISEDELLPGDIGVINGYERESGIGHVGVFLYKDENGNSVYIHESRGVEIGYPTFTKFRRYIYMD